MLGKFLHKGEFCSQKLMNNKLQNTYRIAKVLETSIFGYIFEKKEQSIYQSNNYHFSYLSLATYLFKKY